MLWWWWCAHGKYIFCSFFRLNFLPHLILMPVSNGLSNLSSFVKACFDFVRLVGAGRNCEIVPAEKLIQSITIILSDDVEAASVFRYSYWLYHSPQLMFPLWSFRLFLLDCCYHKLNVFKKLSLVHIDISRLCNTCLTCIYSCNYFLFSLFKMMSVPNSKCKLQWFSKLTVVMWHSRIWINLP